MSNDTSAKQECKLVESDTLSVQIAIDGQAVLLKLVHRLTGHIWADGPVIYRVQTSENSRDVTTNTLDSPAVQVEDNALIVTGQAQHLAVRHLFRLKENALCEQIELKNTAEEVLPVTRLEIGLTWPLTDAAGSLLPAAGRSSPRQISYRAGRTTGLAAVRLTAKVTPRFLALPTPGWLTAGASLSRTTPW